jgi:hypothetical protein
MGKFLICMAAAFIAAAALGVTLDELNIARDPENLDGTIYCKTVYGMNLRAGPGKHFAVLGTVPAGTEVPVLGWITELEGERGFWIRTRYRQMKGWLCAISEGERLLERDGGPLFPMEVKTGELLFKYNLEGTHYPWYEMWLTKGEEVEFATLWHGRLEPRYDSLHFWVKHGGVWGNVCAYATEEFVEEWYKPFVKGVSGENPSGWFVDFPPEFLELNFDYNYGRYEFEFADGAAYPGYYLGPGFAFGEADSVFMHSSVIFVEGQWGLVESWNESSWVYLGTEEEPNVQLTAGVKRKGNDTLPKLETVDLEDVFAGAEEGGDKWVTLYYDIWPASNALYFSLCEPYFSKYIGKVTVKSVNVYQPPDSDAPLYSGPPAAGVEGGWHETVILTYPVELPAGFDFKAPFKIDVGMVYDEAEKFTLTYDCNNP